MKEHKDNQISASEFKKHFLQLVDEVSNNKNSFIITKRKIPVARVVPLENSTKSSKSFFGFLKGTATMKENIVNISFESDWDVHDE
jgi:prevent-host-death family protein